MSRHRVPTALAVVVGLLTAMSLFVLGSAPAAALENPECLACHGIGGTASVQVQFQVSDVDLNRCAATCHHIINHGSATGGYRSSVQTLYGWFSDATSPFTSPDQLHAIHRRSAPADFNPDPNPQGFNACAGCHSQAACSACHGPSVPHTDHTFDTSTSTYAYPPATVTVCTGITSSRQYQNEVLFTTSLTCANGSCHNQLSPAFTAKPRCEDCHGTHGGVAHTYDDFSATCQACHQNTNTLPEIHQPYATSQGVSVCDLCHASGISTGNTANCFDCHSSAGPATNRFPTDHPYDPPTHESTTTSCLGAGCHSSQVPSNHTTTTASSSTNDCERCHQIGYSTTGRNPKDCAGSGCHPAQPADHAYSIPGVPTKHITSWDVATCLGSGCHNSANVWDEHSPRAPTGGGPFRCSTCHASADTAVKDAINANNTACNACHPGVTQQGHYAQHEAVPSIDSTAYGMNSCQNCHRNNLIDQHVDYVGWSGQPLTCASCHQSSDVNVQAAIASGSTRCDSCHTLHGDPIALHETTTTAGGTDCNQCHFSNLGSEHSQRGFACSTCHASTNAGVRAAIEFGDKYCDACHAERHTMQAAKHVSTQTACSGSGCHVIADASANHTTCARCHSQTETPATTDCAICHEAPHPDITASHAATTSASVVGCGRCHDHVVSGKIDVRDMHSQVTSPGPCDVCHANAARVPSVRDKTPECSSCHAVLGTEYHRQMQLRHTATTMSPTCLSGGCHAANTLPEAHEPYVGRYPQYADTCALCHLNQTPGRIPAGATAACDSCHTIHGDLEALHQAPNSQECVDCHETADVRRIHAANPADSCGVCHNATITLPSSTRCTNCHDYSPADPRHYDDATHTATAQTGGCDACHYLGMKPEHFKTTSGPVSCVGCHESKVDSITAAGGWNRTCGACHPTKHGQQDARHVSTRTSCQGAKCHVISDVSTQTASANMHTTCQRCHTPAKYPTTTDCLASGCHQAKPVDHAWDSATMARHVTTWTVTSCIGSGCHVSSNLWNEHQGRTPTAGGSFACATCHDSANATVRTAVLNGRTGCDACHPGANMQGHHEQHNAAGVIDPGCKGCHFEYLDDEHLALGYSCTTCHSSSNTSVQNAISSHNRDCAACHPAVNGRDRHAGQKNNEFIAGNASVHRVYSSLPGMRSSFLVNGQTYSWSLPSASGMFKSGSGMTFDSVVTCDKCHTFSGSAAGPHGASVQVNIDPAYPRAYSNAVLQKNAPGLPSDLLCAKCHTLYNGSSWGNVVHKEHDDRGLSEGGRCVSCHVSIPHGWGRPRLIGSQWDPAPYKTVSGGVYEIALKNYSPNGWDKSDCYAGCSTGRHPNQSNPWPAAPQTVGTLTGRVTNTSGQAISGASITTDKGPAGTTDSNGYYTLAGIATGAYQVTASRTGYASQTKPAAVNTNQTTTLDFSLGAAPTVGTITGRVTDSGGQGISGATVSANTGGYSAATDSNGYYTINDVSPGSYTLTASKTGYNSSSQGISVTAGQTATANFTLPAAGSGNLALGRPTTASSYRSGYEPSKATDGSTSTRWYSNGSSGTQWLRVDLGSSKSIGKVVVGWYGSYYAKKYKIEVSSDGSNWSKVYETEDGRSGTATITFSSTSRRYVRVSCTRANSSSGYSITEFEVYAPSGGYSNSSSNWSRKRDD